MKVAEALLERSSLQSKLRELRERAAASARFQEGEEPAENLEDILREVEGVTARLETLIRQINLSNAATMLNGVTVTAALARRDMLKAHHGFLSATAEALTGGGRLGGYYRSMRSELVFKTAMPAASLRRLADDKAREVRQLDAQIQQSGWETDLIE